MDGERSISQGVLGAAGHMRVNLVKAPSADWRQWDAARRRGTYRDGPS
jgi:hypothetical protein